MENEERRFLVTVVGPTVKIGFTSVLKLLIWSGAAAFAANTLAQTVLKLKATGPQPTVISPSKKEIPLYTASYALLVSASKYLGTGAQGWRPLEETGKDMDRVADVLRGHGFNVWRVSDPTAEELPRIFRKFIAEVGHSKGNRLVFFFSGHGFTNTSNSMGYLVPVDAKDPRISPSDFYEKALPIKQVQIWAEEIESTHAVFLFDSCFSGTIFATKSTVTEPEKRSTDATERWKYLTKITSEPVRQFIAAGGAKEELPSRSSFVPVFIKALEGNASRNKDGYVTSKEIGMYIEQILPGLTATPQTPHSDVIRSPGFAFGDMIFQYSVAKPPDLQIVTAPTKSGATVQGARAANYPTSEKVTWAADAFFDIGSSLIAREGKAKLDDLAAKFEGTSLEVIVAVGSADEGEVLNAKTLAIRRAEAVKAYLVSKGVTANRIYTEGTVRRGVTAEERAAYRRVEIEAVATRLKS